MKCREIWCFHITEDNHVDRVCLEVKHETQHVGCYTVGGGHEYYSISHNSKERVVDIFKNQEHVNR